MVLQHVNLCWVILCWSQYKNYSFQFYHKTKMYLYNDFKMEEKFSISNRSIDWALMDTATWGPNWPGSNNNEKMTLHSSKFKNWGLTTKCNLVSYSGHPILWGAGIFIPLQRMQSLYFQYNKLSSSELIKLGIKKWQNNVCTLLYYWYEYYLHKQIAWCTSVFSFLNSSVVFFFCFFFR